MRYIRSLIGVKKYPTTNLKRFQRFQKFTIEQPAKITPVVFRMFTNFCSKKLNNILHTGLMHHVTVYRERYLRETTDYVIWFDFSMNINLVLKKETQSAHYSGKQQTLHNPLIRKPGSDVYT